MNDNETTTATESIVYVGPIGEESPLFGPLVPGQAYEADAAFAAYLTTKHPDYWTRPDAEARAGGI